MRLRAKTAILAPALCAVAFAAALPLWAAGPVSAPAGKYTVELSTEPSPPISGDNTAIILISEGQKPAASLAVSLHWDMTTMPMPADSKAAPGGGEGQYRAPLKLSMAGQWKLEITVAQMAGMAMAGDGKATFMIETGKSTTAVGGGRGAGLPELLLVALLIAAAALLVVLGIVFRRRFPPGTRGVVVGLLTLLVVFLGTRYVVLKYRDAKTSTVLSSAFMDMDAMKAPAGTVAVTTEVVRRATLQPRARYTGTVLADLEEDVYPRVTGRLLYMPLYPGNRVVPGQLVARLDTSELAAKEAQAAYGAAKASQGVNAAGADVTAQRAGQAKSARMVDQATSGVAEAQAQVRNAEAARKAARSEVAAAREKVVEADGASRGAQAGIDEADAAIADAQSMVDSTEADAAYWAVEIERERTLLKAGAISKEELDRETAQAAAAAASVKKARAGLRAAQARLTRAKEDLAQAQSRVRAAEADVRTAEAKSQQADADRDAALAKVAESRAAVQTALADSTAARAQVGASVAKVGVARAEEKQASAAVTEARTVRGYTEIRASNGGIVTARLVAPGVLVQPGMAILRLAKVDFVRLQANVSAPDAILLREGQPLSAFTVDDPRPVVEDRVTAVFPVSDPAARTTVVESRVKNPAQALRPGQQVVIQIDLGGNGEPLLSVPNRALLTQTGAASVFVIVTEGGQTTAKRVPVKTGAMSNGRTVILAGLKDGAAVIVQGVDNLNDGDRVEVTR